MRRVTISLASMVLAFSAVASGENMAGTATDKFLEILKNGQTDIGTDMIDGPVLQLNGTGPTVENGMYKGLWHWRIVEGKDYISPKDLFPVMNRCKFGGAQAVKTKTGLSGGMFQVIYFCGAPIVYHFMIRDSNKSGMVHIYDLGKALMYLPTPQQAAGGQ